MRRFLLSLALAAALSALIVTAAPAQPVVEGPEGAQKAPLYGPRAITTCKTGAFPTPMAFGFAVLDTPGNEMTLSGEVSLKGAKPRTTYHVVAVKDPPMICTITSVGTITTNRKGNGNLHFTIVRDPFASRFWIDVNPETLETYASPAVELD
jgi:hypothetical protein